MNHKEYIRVVPNSKNAILMVHGIAGTPGHFQDFIPAIPESWSVYNILLDGHGKKAEDFGATSMKRWQQQVHCRLKQILDSHEQVVIVAHSMGTLFAIEEAVADARQITALFLLNVPLQIHLPLDTVVGALRVAFGRTQGHALATAMAKDSSITMEGGLQHYLRWTPRLIELLILIAKVRKDLPHLKVPTQAFQSKNDELVSNRSNGELATNSHVQVTLLQESGHFFYSNADMQLLRSRFERLLQKCEIG